MQRVDHQIERLDDMVRDKESDDDCDDELQNGDENKRFNKRRYVFGDEFRNGRHEQQRPAGVAHGRCCRNIPRIIYF